MLSKGPENDFSDTLYDREGQPCWNCGSPIKRIVQAARSTFFCPTCQRAA
jgi:formamidopyrimidine-DNA glycosylase